MSIQVIACPFCRKPLYLPSPDAVLEEQYSCCCGNCKVPFRQTFGTFIALSCEVVPAAQAKPTRITAAYKLRLQTRQGVQEHEFSISGKSDPPHGTSGDRVSVLHIQSRHQQGQLTCMVNHTLGKAFFLPSLKSSYLWFSFRVGSMGFALSAIAALITLKSANLMVFTALPVSLCAWVLAYQRSKPNPVSPSQLSLLLQEQHHLERVYRLQLKLDGLQSEMDANEVILQRFTSLHRKMFKHRQIYESRMLTVEKAERLLQQKKDLLEQLIGGYGQVIEMIEIERETIALTEALSENFDSTLLRQIRELEAIEAQKNEMKVLIDLPRLLREAD